MTLSNFPLLIVLPILLSGCLTSRPRAVAVQEAETNNAFQNISHPYYRKKVNGVGATVNIGLVGLGAGSGYLWNKGLDGKADHDPLHLSPGTVPGNRTYVVYAAGGAAAGYILGRLLLLIGGNHKKINVPPQQYETWVMDYNRHYRTDWVFLNDSSLHNDTLLHIIPRHRELTFIPKSYTDLREYRIAFPNSIYLDSALVKAAPHLPTDELLAVIYHYPEGPGLRYIQRELISRSVDEYDIYRYLEKFPGVKEQPGVAAHYAEVVTSYPYIRDFLTRYPGSTFEDAVIRKAMASLDRNGLDSVLRLATHGSDSTRRMARLAYLEASTSYRELMEGLRKYPDVAFVISPGDSVETRDQAEVVYNRLAAYRPLSNRHQWSRIVLSLPAYYLEQQLNIRRSNIRDMEDLLSEAKEPWLNNDSSQPVIDKIRIEIVRLNGEDLFIGQKDPVTEVDSGILYRADGQVLRGAIKNRKLNGMGQLRTADGRLLTGRFIQHQLTGQGSVVYPNGTVVEGEFADGDLNGIGTIRHRDGSRDSGSFITNRLQGAGTRWLSNGDVYTGQFEKGLFSGTGTYTWNGGRRWFTGTFRRGLRSGNGTFYLLRGRQMVRGNWKDDCPDGMLDIETPAYAGKIGTLSFYWQIANCQVRDGAMPDEALPVTVEEVLERLPVL